MQGTSPDGAHLGIHLKPLDAAIGWVPAPYHPGGRHGQEFESNTQNTNKTQLLASNYDTFWSLVVCENFVPQNEPSTQLIDATSCVKIWNATIGAEELSYISSYQTLSADKNWKSKQALTKLNLFAGAYYAPLAVKLLIQ